jgi:hypothetical protein
VRAVWVAPALNESKRKLLPITHNHVNGITLFPRTCGFLRYETILDLFTDCTKAHITWSKSNSLDSRVEFVLFFAESCFTLLFLFLFQVYQHLAVPHHVKKQVTFEHV